MSALLSCTDLTMRFGGLTALDKLNLDVAKGDVLGLVGPNGSGKTTFFNVVTGIYRPSAGTVVFDGQDVTSRTAQEIYRLGIARTFQRSRLCLDLTVFDNVMIGNHKNLDMGIVHNLLARGRFRAECKRNLERVKTLLHGLNPALVKRVGQPVSMLSMIDRRRVEVCRALVSDPVLLFLDEPSAGMTHDETKRLMDEILVLSDGGKNFTVVLIEHEMEVIRRVTNRCVVLNFGRKLCEGDYETVTADPFVKEAYLGTELD
ncbi:MAG: ABC transporter ATP-binding protein [Desulfovibrio sp.]|jgi:branched-chain amino acid transport system ATP-binding protein/sulfate-transporting ATPase|nr:ABC transporter ATP-binding protein [Desulfovibrio sp.]